MLAEFLYPLNSFVEVEALLDKARNRLDAGEESKFEKLREVLRDPSYIDEKLIIFTEHRDTADFLVRRLEGLGFTGQVALIHGGLPYQERERQVEFFRRPANEGGAGYLVATDAAGKGINLQFCWLMVNYDIPWNPARLEQRMGRIHRYGQAHDPVVIVNLMTGSTREGRVLKTLLDKLEAIRRQLQSDKVFDVVGRLFEGLSIRNYLERAIIGDADTVAERLEGKPTQEQVRALEQRERLLFGDGGEVRRQLTHLNDEAKQETFRRLLPGYVRHFVDRTAKSTPGRLICGVAAVTVKRLRSCLSRDWSGCASRATVPSRSARPGSQRGRALPYRGRSHRSQDLHRL